MCISCLSIRAGCLPTPYLCAAAAGNNRRSSALACGRRCRRWPSTRSPASRRPIQTQLGTPNRRAPGPRFLQPCTRPSRGLPRRLPVAPLIADKRCYGESPVGLRWGIGGSNSRAGRDALSTRRRGRLMPPGFDPPHPGGMPDNSPTFQRWGREFRGAQVPKGRLKPCAIHQPSLRDLSCCGRWFPTLKQISFRGGLIRQSGYLKRKSSLKL